MTILPSRTTFDIAADISCSAESASSALDSCTTPSTELRMTTNMMMMTSAKSASPLAMPVAAEMAAATISMMIMGSAICWKNRTMSGVFSASLSLLRPSRSRRADASSAERPLFSSDLTSESTSSVSCRYSLTVPSWVGCARQLDARS